MEADDPELAEFEAEVPNFDIWPPILSTRVPQEAPASLQAAEPQAVGTDGNLTVEDRAIIAWYRAMSPVEGPRRLRALSSAGALPAEPRSTTVSVEERPSEAAQEHVDQARESLALPEWLDLESVSAEELPEWLDLDLKEVLEAEAAWTGSGSEAEIERALESLDEMLLVDEEMEIDLQPPPALAPAESPSLKAGPQLEPPPPPAEPELVSGPIAVSELPDWLEMEESVDAAPIADEETTSQEHRLATENLPDWLFIGEEPEEQPAGSQGAETANQVLVQPVVEEELPSLALPDRLEATEETLPSQEMETEPVISAELVPEETRPAASLPEWLEMAEPDLLTSTTRPIVAESAIPPEAPHLAADLSNWLDISEAASPEVTAPEAPLETEVEPVAEELPEWLEASEEIGAEEAEIAAEPVAPPALDEQAPPLTLPGLLEVAEEVSPLATEREPVQSSDLVELEVAYDPALAEPEVIAHTTAVELPDWLDSEEVAPAESPAAEPTVAEAPEPVAHTLSEGLFAEEGEVEAGASTQPLLVSGGPAVAIESLSPPDGEDSATQPLVTNLPSWLTEDEEDGGAPAIGPSKPSSSPQGPAPTALDGPSQPPSMLAADSSVSLVVDVEHSRLRQTMVQAEAEETDFAEIIEEADLPAWLAADHQAQGDEERTAAVVATRAEDEAAPEPTKTEPEAPAREEPDKIGIILSKTFQTVRFPAEQVDLQPAASKYAEVFESAMRDEALDKLEEKSRGSKIAPRIIALLLLAAVLVPFFVPLSHPLPASGSVSTAHDVIERLPFGSAVLVSFDWNGAVNDEMLPVARVLIRHLIAREVKIIAVSVVPEGGRLAQMAIDQENTDHNYVYGTDYVVLGYHPGDETAVRLLLGNSLEETYPADFSGVSAKELRLLRQVSDLQDVSLIVDIAGDPEFMRWWVRQLSMSELVLDSGIRMVGGVTAIGGPEMNTYVQSGQLAGLVVGIRGAAQYEGETDQRYSFLNAQSYAGLMIVMCILAGNVAYLIRHNRK